ncbi:NAD kinase 2, mitochondrial [Diprion similis]|uniref:NAD kinase 2, mitochondrial n=1 Tax=Diprion similis TaxID=362088 RepID=UPI001EF98520|nr:NAD kinase 2, mitochondrial [Diprion similis]
MTALALLHRKVSRTFQFLKTSALLRRQSRIFARHESSFVPKRVLILTKVSRYYFERLREPNLSESQFRTKLIERGSDYDALLTSHNNDRKRELETKTVLEELNIEYRVTNRLTIDRNTFDWADLILPIGGDGTFLFSSNLIRDNKKRIMGINSDPSSSEGYLMLPEKYTRDIRLIFELLRSGDYNYVMRSRIRTTLKGKGIWNPPFHMHEKWRVAGEEKQRVRYTDKDTAAENNHILGFYVDDAFKADTAAEVPKERRLPWLALNEVFVGESLSARTSTLEVNFGDEISWFKIKSCGLCASTGTGSTSWHKAINSLSPQVVDDVLKLANVKIEPSTKTEDISMEYNKRLQFPAEDTKIAYTIRDMIVGQTLPLPKGIQPRGYCKKLIIRSHCFDAGLVLDGGIAVPFNDGTIAVMEIHPEDSLRTIMLRE